MEETKIIYHIDEEETPYLVKIPKAPDKVTLSDFKNVLNRPSYKFFFKSMDADFGVVKEEIVDDDAPLPCFNGRVVSWIVSADSSVVSDNTSQCGETDSGRPSSYQSQINENMLPDESTCTETESVVYEPRKPQIRRYPQHLKQPDRRLLEKSRLNGHRGQGGHGYESSSMISSDLESTSFFDSDDDASSRMTVTTTGSSSVSRVHGRHRRKKQRRHKQPSAMSRTSSISSITDSTMSLNIITVTLNMETVNFLGISIVGQSCKGGDGGIYVGSIMKGGAVALDGRIEPGDMILQVNDLNFENMSNDEAVRVLREVVQKPGPIKLVVAKCWDANPRGYFTIPRTEPVRPIDPGAWVAHTQACRQIPSHPPDFQSRPPSVSTLTSASSSIADSEKTAIDRMSTVAPYEEIKLTVSTPAATIVRAMAASDSGLEIRDRMWLKITIPNAFIGADVVDWLHQRVEGFSDRRESRKFASQLLKSGFIRHTVNKKDFSEQCYYVFGDLCSSFANLKLGTDDGLDADTLCPLPPPSTGTVWGGQMPYSGTFIPPPSSGYTPMPFNYNEAYSFNRDGSGNSGSGGSSGGTKNRMDNKSSQSGSDSDATSQQSARRVFGPGSSIGIASPPSTTMTALNAGERVGSSSSDRSSATNDIQGFQYTERS